jgi:hypothetical protein
MRRGQPRPEPHLVRKVASSMALSPPPITAMGCAGVQEREGRERVSPQRPQRGGLPVTRSATSLCSP